VPNDRAKRRANGPAREQGRGSDGIGLRRLALRSHRRVRPGPGYANRGLELAQDIQNPLAEAAAYQYRGSLHDQRGECARAIADYESARRVAERAGDLFRIYIVKFWESRAHTRAGNASRGRMLVEEGFSLAEQIGTKFVLAQGKVSLAESLLALGEVDEACRVCQEAITLSEESGDEFGAALAHRTFAESLIRLRPPDVQWRREILEAIRIQRGRGAQPELGRSYLSYARLLRPRVRSNKLGHISPKPSTCFVKWAWPGISAVRSKHYWRSVEMVSPAFRQLRRGA
jgi:hypothetical protein